METLAVWGRQAYNVGGKTNPTVPYIRKRILEK